MEREYAVGDLRVVETVRGYGTYARIYAPGLGSGAAATVSKDRDYADGAARPATVNWCAYGAVIPDEAEAMAKVLILAVTIAKRLDEEAR